ncbi:MAG: hypothetical protein O2960_26025 [Verrucomicrobia bacterium]|nr:hypothetical protein [Verrucomicrobiota bacterium]
MTTTETPSEQDAGRAHSSSLERIVKRKAGSCRFSPYYKLEWFDNSLCVWRPLQKSFPTIEQAVTGKSPGRKWRVFKVSETGREIV